MAKKREIIITCNAKQVQDTFDFLNKSLTDIKAKMQTLNEKGAKNGWTEQMKKEFAELEKMATSINNFDLAPAEKAVRKFEDVLKNLAGSTQKDVKRALNEGKSDLNKMSENDPNRAKLTEDLAKIARQIEIIGGKSQSLAEAKKQLSDLANTPTAKLEQGLAAINKELATNAELSESDRTGLKGMARQYEAQLAVNQYGKVGSAPMQTMTDEQLRAEQSRLRSLYMSTQGATGFEGISNDALTRLQQANKLIKDRADAEREAAKAAKEAEQIEQRRLEFAQQGQQTHRTLANMEKASYEDLENALHHLEEQRKKYIQAGDTKHIQRNLQMQDKLKQKQVEMQRLMLSDEQIKDRVQNKEKYNVIQLQQAYDQLKYKLTTLRTDEVAAIKEVNKQMHTLDKTIKGVQGEVTGLQKIWQTAVRNIATYMGVFAIAGFAKNKIQSLVKDNLALSDSMAQVQKVTGLTSEEVKKLNVNLGKMDTRTGIEQLNELAYTAGKMGIGKYGLEGIQGFVKAANELQVALGDDLGSSVEESILPLAKLGENLGLFEKLGTEKAMKAIGSSINELSQTTTAAGKNIVDFARRIQPAAQMIGLTTDEILALGSASDSFGVSSEISATAFTKFLAAYRTNTAEIEKILNMLPGTLDKFFDEGKTMEGLLTIFQRMHEIGDLRYLKDAFDALGSEGSRMFTTFGAFSKNIDMFREHLATSTKAFDEATSVTREYNLVQETAQGIIERSNNIWKNAFVNPDGVDMVKQLADEWYRLSKELTESKTWMTSAKVSLGMLLEAVKLLIEALPTLIRLAGAYGIGVVLQGLIQNFNAVYRAVTIANTGVARFNLLLKTNAIAIAVTVLGYAISKFIDMSASADKAAESVEENTAAMERSKRATQTYTSTMASNYATLMEKYDQLKRQWKALKTEHEKNEWIKKNKSAFEELGLSVTNAASAEEVFEKNTARVVEGFKRRAEAAALAAQMTELYRQQMDIQGEAQKKINEKGVSEGDRVLTNPTGRYERDRNANTFNNGQYTLGNDGSYHYTEKGAEEYNRQLVNGHITEYESIGKKIDKTAKRMEELSKAVPAVSPSSATDASGSSSSGASAKKAAQERKQALRKEMEDAQKASTGIISKLEEYYRLQEAAINDARADGQLTEEQAKEMVRSLNILKNESLATARRAVTTGETKDWDELKTKVLPAVMADTSDVSRNLLSTIQQVAVDKLHADLAKFNGGNGVMGLDSRAFFDQMNAKAAGNTREAARLKAKLFTQAETMVKQYRIFDQAVDKMRDDVEQMGFITETYEEFAERMQKGIMEKPDKVLPNGQTMNDKQIYSAMGFKFLGQGTIPYRINIENEEEALEWMRQFGTTASGELEVWAQAIPELEKWVTLLQRKAELQKEGKDLTADELAELQNAIPQIQALYYKMNEFSDKVPEAISKQVQQMTGRTPIGIVERGEQHEAQVDLTTQLYDNKINEARSSGNEDAALELEKQKKQALIDLEYQYQQELYQIREQMGVTIFDEYEHEVAMYKNMLDKKLISEQEFQKKKGQLQMKLGLNVAQQYNSMMSNMVNALQEAEIASVEAKYDAEINAARANGQDTAALEEQKEAEIMAIRKKYAGLQFAVKISEIIANTAVAIMMAYAQLGPIGGSIAAALLATTGAAQLALAKAEYDKVMGMQAGKKSTSSAKNKPTSGMLTYDKGNVDDFAGRRKLYDDGETQVYGRRRYLGNDGKVYTATAEPAPKDGLITHPIATTVQGQPALVAENGPEIVIGRETTKAIMMNEPDLIRYLATYHKHGGFTKGLRPFDEGNVESVAMSLPQAEPLPAAAGAITADDARALTAALTAFVQQCQKPLRSEINMYGDNGLYEQQKRAERFMARYKRE